MVYCLVFSDYETVNNKINLYMNMVVNNKK